MTTRPRTYVYVDGYNLYFRAIRGISFPCQSCGRDIKISPKRIGQMLHCPDCDSLNVVPNRFYKWLNIQALVEQMFPHFDILKVKYYTATVRSRGDPQKPIRQETFLRALRTQSKIEIYKSLFSVQPVNRELVKPDWVTRIRRWLGQPVPMNPLVKVFDPKEKGSDVNLAVHLVNDAWHDRYDVAIVLSNDSDLIEAIKIVRGERGKKIGVINPHHDPNPQLHKQADFVRQLRVADLVAAQFPNKIPGTNICKPTGW